MSTTIKQLWLLVTDDNNGLAGSIHHSQDDAHASLIRDYLGHVEKPLDFDKDFDEVTELLYDQGVRWTVDPYQLELARPWDQQATSLWVTMSADTKGAVSVRTWIADDIFHAIKQVAESGTLVSHGGDEVLLSVAEAGYAVL